MRPARSWAAFVCILAGVIQARAGDFDLTPAETQKVAGRAVVIRSNLDSAQRRGTVRAAVRISAPPEIVYRQLTQCADALLYVPHMRKCQVRERAPDDSWQLVEHEIDLGWYAPRIRYVFRADLVPDRAIDFRQVSGDFKTNEGGWRLEPAGDANHTLLLYHSVIDPPGYVPNWLARSTYRKELPQMLVDLRKRCEAEQTLRAEAKPPRAGQ